jgi:hypothetical protein
MEAEEFWPPTVESFTIIVTPTVRTIVFSKEPT